MIGPSFCNTARMMSILQTSSPRDFQKRISLTSVHYWGWIHQGDSDYFQCSAWGGGFPTRFSLFSSLSLFFSIVSVLALYRVTYGLSYWGPSIFMHLCFLTLPEYSLRGCVGDIYHLTHSIWLIWPSYTTILSIIGLINISGELNVIS